MYFYRYLNKVVLSNDNYDLGNQISEEEARKEKDIIYYLTKGEVGKYNRTFCLSDVSLFNLPKENLDLLKIVNVDEESKLPQWIVEKIDSRQLQWVNTNYPDWESILNLKQKNKWRINIAGLGDVGGILLSGLRLLGGDVVEKIGIFDIDTNKINRWVMEAGQIMSPEHDAQHPEVMAISKDEIFDCDMFVFTVSIGVPSLTSSHSDVRMAQYEGNSRIIKEYAKEARNRNFKGIFAVVSDPVDLLCKKAFIESNTDEYGVVDYKGLGPDQIRGYGLGVMRARAAYHASKIGVGKSFARLGRAYGPHGKGLVIADNIENYDDKTSMMLTEMALKSNIEVRNTGFKPYIAPALSSGALSILATIKGQWHYSAVFLGGVYFGCRNRLNHSGTELERLYIPCNLLARIKESYNSLGGME
ncbi:lactate dehydrogenase [Lutispora sp.]|uniref:lactate dehydrogenase n=1 Tax=Lutispora sp. TaxID=2828727 RepID=UPI0035679DDF